MKRQKTITITTEDGNSFTFEKKYYIIQGNNGNHSYQNRTWNIFSEGFDSKKEANKTYKETVKENGDIEFGLTPLRICTPEDLIQIYDSLERISFNNCFDIK